VRVALIGAGAIAARHVQVLERRDVTVAAVCDTDAARAAQLAERVNSTAHTNWAAMLEAEQLDAVFVCTPPGVHGPPAVAAFERGLAVYLEKPLARDVEDGAAIVEAWRDSGAVCGVGYQWRSLDLVAELRSLLGGEDPGMLVSRSFGHTESARGDLRNESWFTDQRRSGGILFELGSHDVDLQIALAGPVEWVQGTAATGTLALAGVDGARLDDAVSVIMRFGGGGIGTLQVAWTEVQDPAVYSLDVQAPGAALLLALDPTFRLTGRAGGREIDSTAAADPRESSVDRFLEAARAGDPAAVPCTPADALLTLRTLLACERAIETGERVALSPSPI
jgi:predicted dehydrogenase